METVFDLPTAPLGDVFRAAGLEGRSYLRDAAELRSLWHEYDAAIGYHSTHGAMVDAICGLRGGGGVPADPFFVQLACWSSGVGRRFAAARRALRLLPSREATVLHRVHGPRDPASRGDLFGVLAPLAALTPAVASHRSHLIRLAVHERRQAVEAHLNQLAPPAEHALQLERVERGIRRSTELEIDRSEALRDALRGPHARTLVAAIRADALKMFAEASGAYRAARGQRSTAGPG
jgi:hypothetical protein